MPTNHNMILHEYWITEFNTSFSDSSSLGSSSMDMEYQVVAIATVFISLIRQLTLAYTMHLYHKIPYHTSAFTGEMWVLELINGHPEWLQNKLGVHKDVFLSLCDDLQSGIQIPNMYHLKSNLLYFCIHVSCFLFDMSVSDSNMQQKLHLGTYHKSSLSIDDNSRFNGYFIKMLVIFPSPPSILITSDCPNLMTLYQIASSTTPKFSWSFEMQLE